jgi:hypothetical protein
MSLKFTPIEEKVDDALYKYFRHHWSSAYISPHIPTILALTVVTIIMDFDEEYGVQVAGNMIGEQIEI